MGTRRIVVLALVAGLLAAGAAACAGGAASAPAGGFDYSGGNQKGPVASAAALATNGPAAPGGHGGSQANGANSNPGASAGPADNITRPEDAIVKTGSIRVQVGDLDQAMAAASDQMHGLGGYLAGSERSRSDTYALASVTYRVPVNRFEDALSAARKLGKRVLTEHTETTPVGSQIVDLQARIDNLKAQEKVVQAIMAKATTIQDTLTVENQLSSIQGEIERLNAQLTSLSDQAQYSTLTIELEVPDPSATPTPSATPAPAAAWSASHEFDQAAGVLSSIAQAAATAAIWLIVVILPVVLVALLVVLVGRMTWRLSAPLRRRVADVPRASNLPPSGEPGL